MNRIRLLPEQVANQIAAGEVIERPASVVKELVENSLDAQARRITVEIQSGGKSLVRVTDDGLGMSRDDALLCLERHATSKIRSAEDLNCIRTMGFRGEALPSIASVSRFTLSTREREGEQIEGTQIIINGGKIIEVKAFGGTAGTSIEVRQLFFNLPARRKFLRADETESAHIQHYLTLCALGFPRVGFTFLKDGRMVWQLHPVQNQEPMQALKERMQALQGGNEKLLPVKESFDFSRDEDEEAGELKIWGLIGAPGVSRGSREDQHLFVNGRPIENRALNFALIEGYHTALMKGRYPVCCLFLELSPGEVDVNVHPAKREVKFRHERFVSNALGNAVKKALLAFHTVPVTQTPSAPAKVELFIKHSVEPTTPPPPLALRGEIEITPPAQLAFVPPPVEQPQERPAPLPTPQTPSRDEGPVPLLRVPLRILGVVGKLYVVMESDRGLVLLDQHAAHERVLYEQMLRRLEQNGDVPSQRLLLPETLELSPKDADFLNTQLTALSRLGVGLSEFGERTFILDSLPLFVKCPDARRFVVELIDELRAAGQAVNSMRLGENVVAKTVCRHAVKANDTLRPEEIEGLLHELRHCQMPYTCPHGRPTLIEMNFRDLEKKFGRTGMNPGV